MARKKNKPANKTAIIQIRGKGGYYMDKVVPVARKLVPDGTFERLGTAAGGVLGGIAGSGIGPGMGAAGSALGSGLGARLGRGISKIFGFGDYQVKSNSLFKTGMALPPGESVPAFGVMGNATRVTHREFVKDIIVPASPSAFTNEAFNVNPGDSYTFPWLARLARQYQQYSFNGIVFEFKTLSSDITSGGALGAVIMASNYDVAQAEFADKLHMENSQYAVSAKPSLSQIHTMECEPSETANRLYYVRDGGTIPADQDPRFYDLAKFQLATQGLPGSANTVLGELWVSYDVNLYKPVLDAMVQGSHIIATAATKTNLWGTNGASTTTYGTLVTATAANRFVFNEIGQYLIVLGLDGTGLVSPGFSSSTPSSSTVDNNNGTTSRNIQYTITVSKPGQYVDLDASGSTTVTGAYIRVAAYNVANL